MCDNINLHIDRVLRVGHVNFVARVSDADLANRLMRDNISYRTDSVLHVSHVHLVTRVFDSHKFDRQGAVIDVRFRRQLLVSNEVDLVSSAVVSDGFGNVRCLVEVFDSVSPALFIIGAIAGPYALAPFAST